MVRRKYLKIRGRREDLESKADEANVGNPSLSPEAHAGGRCARRFKTSISSGELPSGVLAVSIR